MCQKRTADFLIFLVRFLFFFLCIYFLSSLLYYHPSSFIFLFHSLFPYLFHSFLLLFFSSLFLPFLPFSLTFLLSFHNPIGPFAWHSVRYLAFVSRKRGISSFFCGYHFHIPLGSHNATCSRLQLCLRHPSLTVTRCRLCGAPPPFFPACSRLKLCLSHPSLTCWIPFGIHSEPHAGA